MNVQLCQEDEINKEGNNEVTEAKGKKKKEKLTCDMWRGRKKGK
jgi:hypothetical protein